MQEGLIFNLYQFLKLIIRLISLRLAVLGLLISVDSSPLTFLRYFATSMWSVCKKELRQFFSGLTGYIAIIVFLLVNGLMLFFFKGNDNILDFGYATLDGFFQLAPWILLLLIPAITMRSLADEFKGGTFEILQTRPLSRWQIVAGKYLGCLTVVLIALLPTIIYFFSIQALSSGEGIDTGVPSVLISVCFFWRRFLLPLAYVSAVLLITPWWHLLSALSPAPCCIMDLMLSASCLYLKAGRTIMLKCWA